MNACNAKHCPIHRNAIINWPAMAHCSKLTCFDSPPPINTKEMAEKEERENIEQKVNGSRLHANVNTVIGHDVQQSNNGIINNNHTPLPPMK